MGPGSRMGFIDERIARMVKRGLSKEHRREFDVEGRSDLKDWDRKRSSHTGSQSYYENCPGEIRTHVKGPKPTL